MEPPRLLNLVWHYLYADATEESRQRIDDIINESVEAWAPLLNPEGTEDRPLGAPSWWNEATAGQETMAGMRTLQARSRRG